MVGAGKAFTHLLMNERSKGRYRDRDWLPNTNRFFNWVSHQSVAVKNRKGSLNDKKNIADVWYSPWPPAGNQMRWRTKVIKRQKILIATNLMIFAQIIRQRKFRKSKEEPVRDREQAQLWREEPQLKILKIQCQIGTTSPSHIYVPQNMHSTCNQKPI